MGSGASMYKTPEEALAAGVLQADIDTFLKENTNALKNEAAVQTTHGPVGPSTRADDLTGKLHPTTYSNPATHTHAHTHTRTRAHAHTHTHTHTHK